VSINLGPLIFGLVVRSTCFVLVHPQGREDTRIALCASRSGLEGCPSSGAARGREDNRASRSAGRVARRWGPRARPLQRSVLGESDMRRDLEPDLLPSRRRRPMHRRCGAIFPRLLRPHAGGLRRHFGSSTLGSRRLAAHHAQLERSYHQLTHSWQLATARASLARARKASSGSCWLWHSSTRCGRRIRWSPTSSGSSAKALAARGAGLAACEMREAKLGPDVISQGIGRARRRPGRVRDAGGEAGTRRHQPRHWPREAQAWPPLARRCYLSSSSSAAILILLPSCSSAAT